MKGEEAYWAGLGPEDAEPVVEQKLALTAGPFKAPSRGLPIAHRRKKPVKVEHTPGPWHDAGPLGAGIYVISERRPIAVVYGPNNEAAPQADAKLIAAAPEMYGALKAYEALENQRMNCGECKEQMERSAEACGECLPFADDARCKIRAAIAKVEASG